MRTIGLGIVLSFGVAACAVGSAAGDGVVVKKGDGGTHDSGSSNNPPSSDQDSGSSQPPNGCTQTTCGSQCVDVTSDANNCGGCGIACATTETCSNGQCSGAQPPPTTGNEPPQGTCSHSLCSSGSALDEGCDTQGCTVVICDPTYLGDDFCCTTSWDSQCAQEVTDYCSPYSCN
jgi:hypothetical protein